MDLIYANANREDIGILKDYEFDLAYGASENDFSLMLDLGQHCCDDDYIIYMIDTKNGLEEGTEYGGVIDTISVDTNSRTVTYKGRTWHGILSNKVIEPEPGQDYRIVNGNANDVLRDLIDIADLSGLFTVDGISPIEINGFRFNRYTDMYSGICRMLAENGGKLITRYEDKMVKLSAVWLVDYSQDDEWDSSQVGFTVSENQNPVNHLVCLGQGNLRDRYVIHLFTDDGGGVQPYALTDKPVKDDDYIFDKRNQILFDQFEVYQTYDNSSAAFTENFVLLNTQPSDWSRNYTEYFVGSDDGQFDNVEGVEEEQLNLLTSQPADWGSRYSNYYTADGKSVQGVATENYEALTGKPADWDKNWTNYFVHFWNGVEWEWRKVDSVSITDYRPQTAKPSDWQTGFGSYYHWVIKYEDVKDKKGKVVKDANGKPKKKKVGAGYENVKKVQSGKKEVVPAWQKGKYFTAYTWQIAPDFASGLQPKYRQVKDTVAPAWLTNTYYNKETVTVAPSWKSNVYYIRYEDHYAELIQGGIERLKEEYEGGRSIDIDLDLLGEYDIGDVVGANENVTGVSVWQPITKKIIKIKNNKRTITYEIGASV